MLNDLSHSAEVTGNVQRMQSRTFILGKKIGSYSLSVAEALFGRLDLSATFDHLRRQQTSSTSTTSGDTKSSRKTELLYQLWRHFN